MLAVTAGLFLLLNLWLPWGIALIGAAALLFGWFKLNQRSALRGSSRAILRSYFSARKSGQSHDEAIRMAVETRFLSATKRDELLARYRSVVDGQPVVQEAEQVRTLVRIIFWFEHGFPPPSDITTQVEHERNLNEELRRLSAKYGVPLSENEPPDRSDLAVAMAGKACASGARGEDDPHGRSTVIFCYHCGQQLRVPTDKGELRVRCARCHTYLPFVPQDLI